MRFGLPFYAFMFVRINFLLRFSGNVTGNDSLFSLSDPGFNPSFVPIFFDDIKQIFGNNTDLEATAKAICGDSNFQCLFDYALTADRQAVTESQASVKEFETEERILRTLQLFRLNMISVRKNFSITKLHQCEYFTSHIS